MGNENEHLSSGFPAHALGKGIVGFTAGFIAKIYAEKAYEKVLKMIRDRRNSTPELN